MRANSIRIAGLLVVMAVLLLGSIQSAWAAGWWKENANDTINEVANNGNTSADVAYWKDAIDNSGADSPHSLYSATSNKCKTCHAVHGALEDSFRLLKNSERGEECNYCHMGPSGASEYRPYALDDLGFSVRGEHTLGSTQVPDSDINGGGGFGNLPDRGGPYDGGTQTLYCYACHSVHGANTIQNAGSSWKRKILRADPAMNGGSVDDGVRSYISGSIWTREDGATIDVASMSNSDLNSYVLSGDYNENETVKAAFCGDCHNKNYNFRFNIEFNGFDSDFGTTQEIGKDWSLTRGSHPMNDNQFLEVGGGAGSSGVTRVSKAGFKVEWCGVCHLASTEYNPDVAPGADTFWGVGYTKVGFPHQSIGNKLLDDAYIAGNRDATQTNDAYESLERMDEICLACHDGLVGETF